MANNKTGFNYYNLDTDRYLDIRIKRLKKDFGCSGIAVYDYLLCEIYRVKGCFMQWDESTAFDVADYFGIKESLVNEIVNYCGVVGLFNRELLSSGNFLTSLSIQRRYIEWSKRAKRTDFKIPKCIKLHEESNIIPEESNIIPEESAKAQAVCREGSKVKRSKEKEEEKEKEKEKSLTRNLVFDFDQLQVELGSSDQYKEDICMLYSVSPDVVSEQLQTFLLEQKSKDNLNRTFSDIKSHFVSWLGLKLQKQTRNDTTFKPVSSGNKETKSEKLERIARGG